MRFDRSAASLGLCLVLLVCLLWLKKSQLNERDALLAYASSCFDVFEPNSAKISYEPRRSSMTLIIAAVSSDDSLKLKAESGLRTGDSQLIYVADKPSSHNSLPQNKGNEAMTYLSYMIDHYDELPEVMVFMHGHRTAWHNNALLRRSSSLTVNKLRPEAVIQSGFVNLGCDKVLQRTIKPVAGALGPSVLDLTREDWEAEDGGSKLNSQSPEQLYGQYESLWRGLFPMPSDPPPPVQWSYFAGGQFALSRKQLELIPKSRLVFLRDWILQSSLSSKSAGAVFETLWEAVFFQGYFNNTATFSTSAGCYCNLYGLCPKNERLPAERIKELLDAATLMMGHLLDS